MRAHTRAYVTDFTVRVDDVSRNFNFARSYSGNFCVCGVWQWSEFERTSSLSNSPGFFDRQSAYSACFMQEQPLIRCEPPCADAVLGRKNRRFAPAFRRFYGKKCRFCRLRAAFRLPFCGLICYNAQRTLLILYFWLLQLIPARGRKHHSIPRNFIGVSITTHPREGTETLLSGTGFRYNGITTHPREGTETSTARSSRFETLYYNSSPRGDGNAHRADYSYFLGITTHPREGTETLQPA